MASFAQAGAGLPPQPAIIPPLLWIPIGKIFPDSGSSTTPSQPPPEGGKRATNLASWFIIISGGVVSADGASITSNVPVWTLLFSLVSDF